MNGNFCQAGWWFWIYCCMSNSYITHTLICAKTCSFWLLSSERISYFQVTSGFASLNFRQKCLHEHELQLFDFYVWKYLCENVRISGINILFTIFAEMVGYFASFVRHYYSIDTNFLFNSSRITVVHVHVNILSQINWLLHLELPLSRLQHCVSQATKVKSIFPIT